MFRITVTIVAILMLQAGSACLAQEEFAPSDHQPWSKFLPGSWKRVRHVVETLDKSGAVKSVTRSEITTTLESLTEDAYTLRVDTKMVVGGKTLVSQPRRTQYSIHGGTPGQTVSVKRIGEKEVVICGNRVAAEQHQVTLNGDDNRQISMVYFSEQLPPHVLKRDTIVTDSLGKETRMQTQAEVVALDVPSRILNKTYKTSHVRTIQRPSSGLTVETLEVHCPEIPGGLVSQSTKTLDANGMVTERRTVELTAFESHFSDDNVRTRRRVFSRNRR